MAQRKTIPLDEQAKIRDLEPERKDSAGTYLTTDQGIRVDDTDNSLKVSARGPTLLEDFHFREKIMRFDHERIPERVVHARGSAAHGYFQVYQSLKDLTRARFLQEPSVKTPVFVRFSTVVGSRGSADTVRDVRGFATKFYTEEGNFDLVGNNIPVFFIQDGIKFPDVVHAVKPEPDREIPQASSAHDTFWDFASLVPETTHMLMWILSDRAIPRSFRMMEGFGVHTFRLVNEEGRSRFVKFHWKPLLGVHSFVWDEAQKIAGKDPDFHRRDLWNAIEKGSYPEYELGLQIIEEDEADSFDFDLLDPTKIVPEELVPVRRVGKLVLNRNPDNFFAETEQVAFCVQNVVPGIDFTDDPLMHARLFSYLDTQLTRLGGPNFAQIPINRPLARVDNHQEDGFHQHRVPTGRAHYTPNSLGGGCPMVAGPGAGTFTHYPEKLAGVKQRARSESFGDHFTQATLFWNSMSMPEKEHLVKAAVFELGKCQSKAIRERMVERFTRVDVAFGQAVATGLGLTAPASVGATVKKAAQAVAQKLTTKRTVAASPALSMENTVKNSIRTRRIAILAEKGVSLAELSAVRNALVAEGAEVEVISSRLGTIEAAEGGDVEVDQASIHVGSILYDAVFVPGGAASVEAMKKLGDPIHFVNEAFRHNKPIGATGEGVELLLASGIKGVTMASVQAAGQTFHAEGVVTVRGASDLTVFLQDFVKAIAQHRHWNRTEQEAVPA
ncbi:catalase [Polyangium sorediatum]|uniref:Catalase n=1 Tax=Polyangium sorediatum TaxID=889274 RepID=A0ABT6NJD7_9BACT|nr:catalase [Polyangium sorediatum]MDI1428426.1 catalase [Polyangium sorediatum]